MRIDECLVLPAVPDADLAGAVRAFVERSLELKIAQAVIRNGDGEAFVVRVHRRALRHRPRLSCTADLKPQIEVQTACVVLVDDEPLAYGFRIRHGVARNFQNAHMLIILSMERLVCILLTIGAVVVFGADAQKQIDQPPQPTLLSAPQPVYPKAAKDAGIGGRITVRVTVGESGEVLSVGDPTGPTELCKGGTNDPRIQALRDSVVDSLRQAKFAPAMKDGKPVKTTIWLTSTFDAFGTPDAGDQKKLVTAGVVNGRAIRLPKPEYPGAARSVRASGAVSVRVLVDEAGKVFTAEAMSGHPLLRSSAINAACSAKFSSTQIDGKPVRVSGIITYFFIP